MDLRRRVPGLLFARDRALLLTDGRNHGLRVRQAVDRSTTGSLPGPSSARGMLYQQATSAQAFECAQGTHAGQPRMASDRPSRTRNPAHLAPFSFSDDVVHHLKLGIGEVIDSVRQSVMPLKGFLNGRCTEILGRHQFGPVQVVSRLKPRPVQRLVRVPITAGEGCVLQPQNVMLERTATYHTGTPLAPGHLGDELHFRPSSPLRTHRNADERIPDSLRAHLRGHAEGQIVDGPSGQRSMHGALGHLRVRRPSGVLCPCRCNRLRAVRPTADSAAAGTGR